MSKETSASGFTLIEVLIALAILALALPVILTTLGDTLRRTHENEARMAAASLAQSLLASAGTEAPLQIGETHGNFGNGYGWTLAITPYDEPGSNSAWSVMVYRVAATVSWSDAHPAKSLRLATLRLAPKERGP